MRPATQAVASLPAEQSSASPSPPEGTRPWGSCFTHPPTAILICGDWPKAIRNPDRPIRMALLRGVWCVLRLLLLSHSQLLLENLALRQQLAVLRRTVRRPRLRPWDRVFWVWLSRWWAGWKDALVIVTPATVVGWHRKGFRLYWRWKSRGRPGRPRIDPELRRLIRCMSRDNPLWGAPRIQAELGLLGHDLAESTVGRYMDRRTRPPSPNWRSFLANHADCLASVDFFVVPTVTFKLLYAFVVLCHHRRRVAHVNVTSHPTADWVARQIKEAFPFDEAPRYLIRDRDAAYGECFRECMESMGIEEVLIAPRSPWQSPYVERLIGSIRRECLDHVIVFGEAHLRRVLARYFDYYHHARTHHALGDNAPCPRAVESPGQGNVIAVPQVGGLHHRYTRVA
jgi:putative transposase